MISKDRNNKSIYMIKILLLETQPSVWRQFLVSSNITLHSLHLVVQDIMGWTKSHSYKFQIDKNTYANSDPGSGFNKKEFIDSRKTVFEHVINQKGETFRYEYDFGDSWNHMLLIEDIFKPKPGKKYPVCVSGERACPPEDCGGIHGYADLLNIIKEPSNEQYLDTITWLGGHFDPDLFDTQLVNRKLRSLRF